MISPVNHDIKAGPLLERFTLTSAAVILLLGSLLDTPPYNGSITEQCSLLASGTLYGPGSSPCLFINEIYPDPGMDIDGNGVVDQEDEFIEILNLDMDPVPMDGLSLTDGTSTYYLEGGNLGVGEILFLNRSVTGLKLGRDDSVTLLNETGHALDSFAFSGASRGVSYQRSSSEVERWMTTREPTPGTTNLPSPSMLINEVMVDPLGANGGKQWIEILNTGIEWDLSGFSLNNHDGVYAKLPSIVIGEGERVLIHLGSSQTSIPHPDDVPVIYSEQTKPLFTSGDDLELTDRDGYSVDFVAWGNSSHVDGATGKGKGGEWLGRIYDDSNGSMTADGEENPIPLTGRTLSRSPDGLDSDSPHDWYHGPSITGGTPGFNNSIDPGILIEPMDERLSLNESCTMNISVSLHPGTNMTGRMIVTLQQLDDNWDLSPHTFDLVVEEGIESISIAFTITAPDSVEISHTCDIIATAFWSNLSFLVFNRSINVYIPSFNAELMVDGAFLDGFESSSFPEGSFIEIRGQVKCSGEVTGGSTTLYAALFDNKDPDMEIPLIERELDMKDLGPRSIRSFRIELDTINIWGNLSMRVILDPMNLMKEYCETDNEWETPVDIIPTVPDEGVSSLLITDVLWNASIEEGFVRIKNPSDLEVSLQGIRLCMDGNYIQFPDEAALDRNGSAVVAWSEESARFASPWETVYRADDGGPLSMRMDVPEGPLDLSSGKDLWLSTRYRDEIDRVVLRRNMLPEGTTDSERAVFPETTYGTMLERRRNTGGDPIDTDSILDWTVQGGTAFISRVLIDPGPQGPGEFISISSMDDTCDMRGFGLVQGRGMAVIPWSIEGGREITISMDPERYIEVQDANPDLTTSLSGSIPSAKVEGWTSLLLPNKGGELILVDRGNRVIDRFGWGEGHSTGTPDAGLIMGRDPLGNEMGQWKIVGAASLPLFPARMEMKETVNSTVRFTDPLKAAKPPVGTRKKFTVILPSVTTEEIAGSILDIRDLGYIVDLFITIPPWGRSDKHQVTISPEQEMGWMKELENAGISIYCSEEGFDSWGPGVILNETCIGTFTVPPGEGFRAGYRKTGLLLSTSGQDTLGGLERIHDMLDRHEWYDPSHLLDEVETSRPNITEPFGTDEADDDRQSIEARMMIGWGVDPSVFVDPGDRLRIFHRSGAIDMTTLGELLRAGVSIELGIGPGNLRIGGDTAAELALSEEVLIRTGKHYLDADSLGTEVIPRTAALTRAHGSSEAKPDVFMMGPFDTVQLEGELWIWDDGMGLSMAEDPYTGMHCWLIVLAGNKLIHSIWELPDMGSSFPFPIAFLPDRTENRELPTSKGPEMNIILERIYPDTYLKEDPEEALYIRNIGREPADISGFYLTDDEGYGLISDGVARFPRGTILEPGAGIWVARDWGAFRSQFGYDPNLSLFNTTSGSIMEICSGDLRLSNTNDSVCLRDPFGRVVDVVPYGRMEWPQLWTYLPGGEWSGEPVPLPGWGKILQRTITWEGISRNIPCSIRDWSTARPFYPGQSYLEPGEFRNIDSIMIGVCPESGSDLIEEIISGARYSIRVNAYELASRWIVSSLVGAAQRGVEVKVILEGGPVGGVSIASEVAADLLTEGGVEVRWMQNDIPNNIRDRYRYDHAKYIVVDGSRALISTDNFKDSSFPRKGCSSGSTRGWLVQVESEGISRDLEDLFNSDWEGPDMRPNTVEGEVMESELEWFESSSSQIICGTSHSPFLVTEPSRGCVLVSPDHLSLPDNPLVGRIRNAVESIDLELLDISADFDLGGVEASRESLEWWGVDPNRSFSTNPYLNELILAAGRGVKVRILVDGSDFDGDGIRDQARIVDRINSIAAQLDLEEFLMARISPVPYMQNGNEIALIHTKGAIFDGKSVWLSSFNWGPTSCLENREVGILMDSRETAENLKGIFLADWGATIQDDIELDLKISSLTRIGKDDLEYEISIDARWRGREELIILLESVEGMEGMYELSRLEPGFDGTVKKELQVSSALEGMRLEVRLVSGDRTFTWGVLSLTSLDTSEGSGGSVSLIYPYLPLIYISAAALLISLARSLYQQTRENRNRNSTQNPEE